MCHLIYEDPVYRSVQHLIMFPCNIIVSVTFLGKLFNIVIIDNFLILIKSTQYSQKSTDIFDFIRICGISGKILDKLC